MTKEELKKEVVQNIEQPKETQIISEIVIILLTNIVEVIIQYFIQKCLNRKKTIDFKNLNKFEKMFLKKHIHLEVIKHKELSKEYKSKIYKAFIKTSDNHENEEIYQIIKR